MSTLFSPLWHSCAALLPCAVACCCCWNVPRCALSADQLSARRAASAAVRAHRLSKIIAQYKITSPPGNGLSAPYAFNLMFVTQIGPSGKVTG